MSAIFYSRNDQVQMCSICRDQGEEAIKENGPIVNHLVKKHDGAHAGCLAAWFNSGNSDCSVCRVPLNPHSFPFALFGREIRQIAAAHQVRSEEERQEVDEAALERDARIIKSLSYISGICFGGGVAAAAAESFDLSAFLLSAAVAAFSLYAVLTVALTTSQFFERVREDL